jgi:DNA-binding LytR/AlgR family response regulator
MPIRCIAIDDEPFALEILRKEISKIPYLELLGTFVSPFEARAIIQQGNVDLLFLDIQMPTLTGLQFLRSLPQPPLVILTTAYEQYALEGFDLNVVDYLVKPTPFDRFLRAVNKAQDLLQLKGKEAMPPPVHLPERPFFFVHSAYREIKIFQDELLYAEGLKDYVKLYTMQHLTKPLLIRMTLKSLEAKLDSGRFCRVHQSFIVNVEHISSFQRARVFIGSREIPVGGHFSEAFEKMYRQTH